MFYIFPKVTCSFSLKTNKADLCCLIFFSFLFFSFKLRKDLNWRNKSTLSGKMIPIVIKTGSSDHILLTKYVKFSFFFGFVLKITLL